jgi:hypothetical protein
MTDEDATDASDEFPRRILAAQESYITAQFGSNTSAEVHSWGRGSVSTWVFGHGVLTSVERAGVIRHRFDELPITNPPTDVHRQAAGLIAWLLATKRPLPIPPASDKGAEWELVRASESEWQERGGLHPMWSRGNQLAAVAVLRAAGLVTITTGVFDEDVTDDDPGVTIYVHLADA